MGELPYESRIRQAIWRLEHQGHYGGCGLGDSKSDRGLVGRCKNRKVLEGGGEGGGVGEGPKILHLVITPPLIKMENHFLLQLGVKSNCIFQIPSTIKQDKADGASCIGLELRGLSAAIRPCFVHRRKATVAVDTTTTAIQLRRSYLMGEAKEGGALRA